MMGETNRLALPLIEPGQAQKEMTHNEALARLDLLTQAAVAAVSWSQPPDDPEVGRCWIIGDAATGAWAGQAGALAGWTVGGWRFAAPHQGMSVWSEADDCVATFTGGAWQVGRIAAASLTVGGVQVVGAQAPAIRPPAGGGTVDAEARDALTAVLATLRTHGLIAG
jgi:hypothetical protein